MEYINSEERCVVSPTIPFPPVSWWQIAAENPHIYFDGFENFQKMSLRNRFYLAGPTGRHLLSIPLIKGRGQRTLTKDVKMDHRSHWGIKHWRTIQSFYGRAPFFEFYEGDISPLFLGAEDTESLFEWNLNGVKLLANLIGIELRIEQTNNFKKKYTPETADLRFNFQETTLPHYHQVFMPKNSFVPDCSVLDLLFCEGSNTSVLIKK